MNVLLNTNTLIEESNNYNVNFTINNKNFNMIIKKNDSLQNLYDQVSDKYMNIKINNSKPDVVINEKEYWFNDKIENIYAYHDDLDNKKYKMPKKKNILVNDYIKKIIEVNNENNNEVNIENNNEDNKENSVIDYLYNLISNISA